MQDPRLSDLRTHGAPLHHFPTLEHLLAVISPGGSVIGAMLGLIPRPSSDRQMLENVALGAALGAVAGLGVAFAVAAGIALGGG